MGKTPLERVLTDVRALLAISVGLVVSIFGGGWVALAKVRTEARDAAQEATAGLETEQRALQQRVESLQSHVADLRDETLDVRAEVRALRRDLRILFPRLPADGGVGE